DPRYEPGRSGCIVVTCYGGTDNIEDSNEVMRDHGAERVSPLSIPLLMSNGAAAALAMRYGLRGEAYSVVSACAAGAQALGAATRTIRSGEADAVVAGGSEAALTPLARAAFSAMDATS